MKPSDIHGRTLLTLTALFTLQCSLLASNDDTDMWTVGAASVRITPETPVWMAGYASRTGPSEGVLLDLHASAIVLTDVQQTRLAVVSLDLIEIPESLRTQLQDMALKNYGLKSSNLLLNVSHTHGGPMLSAQTVADWGADPVWGDRAEAYVRDVVSKVDELLKNAIEKQQPAQVSFGRSTCALAMNRRLPTPEGMRLAPNPNGPTDHDVPVLQVRSVKGELIAVAFGYACHNTTMGGIPLLNGDYAGYARHKLETDHPGAVAMFLGGCGGDQDPVLRGGPAEAEQNGNLLATAVEQTLNAKSTSLPARLKIANATIPLEFAALPPRPDLEVRAQSGNGFVARHAQSILKNWPGPNDHPPAYQYPIQVMSLGDQLTLIALGGEPVADYSLRLKKELSGQEHAVWVAGYSNLVNAYIPNRRVLEEGGYEGTEAIIYQSLPAPFRPELEDQIVSTVRKLFDQIHSK